jgi:peptidoglycan pentaglycine glycine transferase (the first glycine)
MIKNTQQNEFLQQNSPDGGILQSSAWQQFQEAVGRKTHVIESAGFSASIIEHALPIVGKFFYIPRGPILNFKHQTSNIESLSNLLMLAKKEDAGWIRIDTVSEDFVKMVKENASRPIVKAPHDVQAREIFVLDISKSSEQLFSDMKPETRYNIGKAKKNGVVIKSNHQQSAISNDEKNNYVEEFLRLTKEMAERKGFVPHDEVYYRKMAEALPSEMFKIYVAAFDGETIAAAIVSYFGKFATYLHGASGNDHRKVKAPHLLHWQAILDAKERGCESYDFGGVKTSSYRTITDMKGVTQFKLGFSAKTAPVVFPGAYDIIITPGKYAVYRGVERTKTLWQKIRR